jgi:uncharacterized protein (DUF305 family)
MIKTVGLWAGGVVLAVLLVVGGVWVHGLTPNAAAVEEGDAFTAVDNTMMAAMMGKAVVYSGDTDADFAMLMIPHHQGAIDAAGVELKYGVDPAIRLFADKVIAAQQPQIDQMTQWRHTHPSPASTPNAQAEQAAFTASSKTMVDGMMSHGMGHSGKADLDFIRMMIPHHQGAVDMGQVELKYGTDPDLRRLAQTIITDQQAEIAQMKRWSRR